MSFLTFDFGQIELPLFVISIVPSVRIQMRIHRRANEVGGAYLEFDYPANLNEIGDPRKGTYLWKVGKIGEMDGKDLMASPGKYRIKVGGSASEVFLIIECE